MKFIIILLKQRHVCESHMAYCVEIVTFHHQTLWYQISVVRVISMICLLWIYCHMLVDTSSKMLSIMLNTLRLRQNGRHFPDDIFKWIFLNENVWISISISLKFVPRGPINNISTLVQVMAWRRPGDKPLSEPMMVRLPMHICVTRPQWVNALDG